MNVTALVINYNAGHLLCDCVQSLLDNGVSDIRVVDNASSDDSFALLQEQFGHENALSLLPNAQNVGFGPAINAALPGINTPYLLIINPDCRLDPGAISALLAALNTDTTAALAGPLVLDRHGQLESATNRRFATPWRALMAFSGLARLGARFPALAGITVSTDQADKEPKPVEATSGACMLLRTGVLRQLGGFDEAYGLHCEDLDLMYRLRQAGYQVLLAPSASAVHQQGVSSASRPLWVHRQKHRGMARFFNVHLAEQHSWPVTMLVRTGIWFRWALFWPLVALRK